MSGDMFEPIVEPLVKHHYLIIPDFAVAAKVATCRRHIP